MTIDQDDTRTFSDPLLGAGPLGPVVDDDLDRPAARDIDPLAILAEIAAPVVLPDVIIPHRFRPGWAVRYSLELDSDDLKRWRKRATLKPGTKREEFDEIRFACIVMANQAQALLRNDEEVADGDGTVLTFAHPAVWRMYGAERAADAVRKFYGNDPYLAATFDAMLAAAGVGDEVETLDPTRPSSD